MILLQKQKSPCQKDRGSNTANVETAGLRPLFPRKYHKSIGMAGLLAPGSHYLPRLPGYYPSGIMRRSSPVTVAGQRGSHTLFPIILGLTASAPILQLFSCELLVA